MPCQVGVSCTPSRTALSRIVRLGRHWEALVKVFPSLTQFRLVVTVRTVHKLTQTHQRSISCRAWSLTRFLWFKPPFNIFIVVKKVGLLLVFGLTLKVLKPELPGLHLRWRRRRSRSRTEIVPIRKTSSSAVSSTSEVTSSLSVSSITIAQCRRSRRRTKFLPVSWIVLVGGVLKYTVLEVVFVVGCVQRFFFLHASSVVIVECAEVTPCPPDGRKRRARRYFWRLRVVDSTHILLKSRNI